MPRRTPLHSVPSPGHRNATPTIEWVGGRLPTKMAVQEGGHLVFADLVLWMELPSGLLLGTRVMEPGVEADALASLFVSAMHAPAAGRPRIPDRVRVRTNNDAVVMAAVLPGGVSLQVAPAPELDEVLADFHRSVGNANDEREEASYFDDGASAPMLELAFRAARQLYKTAPWKLGYDFDLLRVDVPEMGIEGTCVSILGIAKETPGISLFDSLDDYLEFLAATEALGDLGDAPPPPSHDFGASWHMLSFDRAADLVDNLRREVREYGWPVAGPKAYPMFSGHGRNGDPLPLDDDDLLRLTVCADAVAAFATQHADMIRRMKNGKLPDDVISLRHQGDGLPECEVSFPYEPEIWDDGEVDDGLTDADRAAIVHAYKIRHYETWPDTPLPALGLRTPRQACKTKAGRKEVDLLLRDMESHEARQPEAERYDFAGVRRELEFG